MKEIPEIIIDRAVELWKRVLEDPEYQVVEKDASAEDQIYQAKCSGLANMVPNNATPELLEAFGKELKQRLLKGDEAGYKTTSLDVDYHPDKTLADSAQAAGLKLEFPYKTHMHLYFDCVSFTCGYRSEQICHYPMKDGKWLTTTLRGSDIAKVIEYVEGGKPVFEVENE